MHQAMSVILVAMQLVSMATALPGGLRQLALDNEDARRMATLAVRSMGSEYTLINVTNANIQVVAGFLYHLEMTVRQTTTNTEPNELSCYAEVHTEPWARSTRLTSFCCTVHVDTEEANQHLH